jgi:hypothetical protein
MISKILIISFLVLLLTGYTMPLVGAENIPETQAEVELQAEPNPKIEPEVSNEAEVASEKSIPTVVINSE